eukprot:916923-Pyramimonas_sp.AAC.1
MFRRLSQWSHLHCQADHVLPSTLRTALHMLRSIQILRYVRGSWCTTRHVDDGAARTHLVTLPPMAVNMKPLCYSDSARL